VPSAERFWRERHRRLVLGHRHSLTDPVMRGLSLRRVRVIGSTKTSLSPNRGKGWVRNPHKGDVEHAGREWAKILDEEGERLGHRAPPPRHAGRGPAARAPAETPVPTVPDRR
jgi:hypothetical protein